jgi:flavin-dependent dehydrogenase
MEETDILVIGAGPSGSVAASIAHKQGLKVKVIEKLRFPRFVIGESLLPRCMVALETAELLDAVKACGFQEKFGAKFIQDGKVCEFNFADQFSDGWNWTWQVPCADFDLALITEVERKGVDVTFGLGVTGVEFFDGYSHVSVEDESGNPSTIKAKFIIDSSGYGRVLPRLLNLDKPSNLGARKSLFTHVKDIKRPTTHNNKQIIVVDHKPGVWIWMIPFSNGNCSVGFVGYPEFFDQFEGTDEEKLRAMIASDPNTAERFNDVPFIWDTPKSLLGYSIATQKFYDKGFALTGNAAEFLDPVFSSGVTFAVESGMRAAQLASKQIKGEDVDWDKDYGKYISYGVDVFRTYVMSWYDGSLQKIFFAKDTDPGIKARICSVLAGYVWDESNYYVREHRTGISTLAKVVDMYQTT